MSEPAHFAGRAHRRWNTSERTILVALLDGGGSATSRELAGRTGYAPNTATQTLTIARYDELVEPDPGKRYGWRLTTLGREVVAELAGAR